MNHLKRIFLALEIGKKKRGGADKERRKGGAEQKEKVRWKQNQQKGKKAETKQIKLD